MKNERFSMRISEDAREDLRKIAEYHGISSSSAVCLLIKKEARLLDAILRGEKMDEGFKSI